MVLFEPIKIVDNDVYKQFFLWILDENKTTHYDVK